MKLYRPLKRDLMTQAFGPGGTTPSLLPAYQQLGLLAHNGIDWSAEMGEDIRFNGTGKGKVIEVSLDTKAGLGVVVFFQADGLYWKTLYWHLKEVRCKIGDMVESGDLLGLADNTGWSTGSHLHFGLKLCDREAVTLNYENGYHGAVDPLPFYINKYILDYKVELQGQMVVLLQKVIELLKKILWRN